MDGRLARHIAEHLRNEAVELTRKWIAILEERLDLPPERTLPGESILDHIPVVLRTIADYTENPGEEPLDSLVRSDLGTLADLRRRQGFTPAEVLIEFGILSELVEDSIVSAVEDYDGDVDRRDLVRTVGKLKDAIFLLGTETAARFRLWRNRRHEERLRLIEAYTAMLSHELGNRLGAAETAISLIMEEGDTLSPERVASLHELILRSLKSGRETVQGVRSLFGRGERAATDSVRMLPLGAVIRDAVHEMRIAAAERNIELELVEAATEEPIDAERFPLAFFNLVTNAIRHHDVPHGTGRVVVQVSEARNHWTVSVTDDGPGIPDSLRNRLFEPLTTSPNGPGAGLGLAIARGAVEQMGGRIWFEPATGRGTRFQFTMRKLERPAEPDQM
jgi:signal transduction histidine kinase